MKKQIITNLTLKAYEKKYKNHKKHLLSFSKNEVETLDKQAGTIGENYVLKKRRWALIGDTYYELPKPYRKMWFRGLTAAGKMWACIIPIGVVGALGGAGYGVYYLLNNGGIKIKGDFAKYVKVDKTEYDQDGNYVISFAMSDNKKIYHICSCRIGDTSLSEVIGSSFNPSDNCEFMFKDFKVIISKNTMNAYKGRISIEPEVCNVDEYEYYHIEGADFVSKNLTASGELEFIIQVETGTLSDCEIRIGTSILTKGTDFTFGDNNVGPKQYKIVILKEPLTTHSGLIYIKGIKTQ